MLGNVTRPDIVAVDPGSEHVGLAVAWMRDPVNWATEIVEPAEALRLLRYWVNGLSTLIVEQWVLYGSSMAALQGSSLPEVRLIGRIEEIAQYLHPPIVWQRPVDVLKPARAKAQRRGFDWVSPASPDHARDAEAHLWWWLWQNRPLLQPGQGVYYGDNTD